MVMNRRENLRKNWTIAIDEPRERRHFQHRTHPNNPLRATHRPILDDGQIIARRQQQPHRQRRRGNPYTMIAIASAPDQVNAADHAGDAFTHCR